jgi:hypothetical protein
MDITRSSMLPSTIVIEFSVTIDHIKKDAIVEYDAYESLKDILPSEITEKLPEALKINLELQSSISIKETKRGSFKTIIIVALALYEFMAKYKDFNEGILLLQKQVDSVIKNVLKSRGDYSIDIRQLKLYYDDFIPLKFQIEQPSLWKSLLDYKPTFWSVIGTFILILLANLVYHWLFG